MWLWLTTGMNTKEWVAIHRKHHNKTDVEGDPHSPHIFGFFTVLFKGVMLYVEAAKDKNLITNLGIGTPNDWIEQKLYTPYPWAGVIIMLIIDVMLFGWWGFLIWGIQMIWIPFWAAGVVNGIGHWFGYRNGETKDKSKNVLPWDIIVGGELLHNNHHLDPGNARLSKRWFELDMGWVWLSFFRLVRLAKLR
jgi:stearoyl-CoA desaturase (delta-9 desaturase)